jgi:Undecaprenyl-phosphate glucose phosphotransferase
MEIRRPDNLVVESERETPLNPKQEFRAIGPVAVKLLFWLADAMIIVAAAGLIYWLYLSGKGDIVPVDRYPPLILISVVLSAYIFPQMGLYNLKLDWRPLSWLTRVGWAWGNVVVLLVIILFATKTSDSFSRVWFTSWAFTAYIGLVTFRALVAGVFGRWIPREFVTEKIVVVGEGEALQRLLQRLNDQNVLGPLVVAVFSPDDLYRSSPEATGFLEGLSPVVNFVNENNIEKIVLVLPGMDGDAMARIREILSRMPVTVLFCPNMSLEPIHSHPVTMVGVPMLQIFDRPLEGWRVWLKTAADKIFAVCILVLASPVLAATAVMVKFSGPGPVLFKQPRYGFRNRIVSVLKFRTLHWESEDVNGVVLCTEDDPRVTPIGKFLRRCFLDELPQLINVIRGEMSLVGPRPHALEAKAENIPYHKLVDEYAERHRVKPGITGWAQVNGLHGEANSAEDVRKRVDYDLYYIRNWSFMFDLKILVLTWVRVFLRVRGR